jgi:beta-galactosidase/beta-glucuronidase
MPRCDVRRRTNLNREWRFAHGDHASAEGVNFDDGEWQQIGLPHSFSIPYFQQPDFSIGPGWYRRRLVLDREQLAGVVRLDFEGAFQVADVYLNGALVGRHEGGYTGFSCEVQSIAREGVNLVAVRVDNTWNPQIAPLGGEHVFSGGLYRDVWLDTTGPLHVDWYGTKVTTSGIETGGSVSRSRPRSATAQTVSCQGGCRQPSWHLTAWWLPSC